MISWWLLALAVSFLTAFYIYSNQILKLSSSLLMVYRGLGSFFVMLFFIWGAEVDFSWKFYMLCVIQGLLVGYNDNRFFQSSKVFGAEITGIVQPLGIALTFFLWFFVKPSEFFALLSEPMYFILIILCVLGIIVSALVIRKVKANSEALKFLLPCIVLFSIIDVVNKQCMGAKGDNQAFYAVCYYVMILGLIVGIYNLVAYYIENKNVRSFFEKKNFIGGFLVALISIVSTGLKAYAMDLTPNPAYVSSIILLAPIWIVLGNSVYYKIINDVKYIRVDKKALAILILSIITLVIITR